MFRATLAFTAVVLTAASASAQSLGTFVWQTQPYCNRLALALTSAPGGFTVIGTDDGCGAPKKASVTGTVVLNADATASLRVTVAPPDGGRSVELSATVSTANGSGIWSDAFGQSGTFALGGAALGLPVRPLAAVVLDVADNPLTTTDPCSIAGGRQEMVLCGTSAAAFRNAPSVPGLQVWRDDQGLVHIRGGVRRSNGSIAASVPVMILPAALRPKRRLVVPVGAGSGFQQAGTLLLTIYGPENPLTDGLVEVASNAFAYGDVHLGEIVFTVDR